MNVQRFTVIRTCSVFGGVDVFALEHGFGLRFDVTLVGQIQQFLKNRRIDALPRNTGAKVNKRELRARL